MQIIEYFEDGQKEHWIKEIEGFSWGAAKYLAKLLRENRINIVGVHKK